MEDIEEVVVDKSREMRAYSKSFYYKVGIPFFVLSLTAIVIIALILSDDTIESGTYSAVLIAIVGPIFLTSTVSVMKALIYSCKIKRILGDPHTQFSFGDIYVYQTDHECGDRHNRQSYTLTHLRIYFVDNEKRDHFHKMSGIIALAYDLKHEHRKAPLIAYNSAGEFIILYKYTIKEIRGKLF